MNRPVLCLGVPISGLGKPVLTLEEQSNLVERYQELGSDRWHTCDASEEG